MDQSQLFADERMITQADNKLITLTTHRIRYNSEASGRAHLVSIFLDKISSIEVLYQSNPYLLVAGIIASAVGLVAGAQKQSDVLVLGVIIGGVLLAAYFLTRKHVVSIVSDGGTKIVFETKGMAKGQVVDFVNNVERAKKERAYSLV